MLPSTGAQGATPTSVGYDLSGIGLLVAIGVAVWAGISLLGRRGPGAKLAGTGLLVLAGWWFLSARGQLLAQSDIPSMEQSFANWLAGVGGSANPGNPARAQAAPAAQGGPARAQ